jgi:hypothetical protein
LCVDKSKSEYPTNKAGNTKMRQVEGEKHTGKKTKSSLDPDFSAPKIGRAFREPENQTVRANGLVICHRKKGKENKPR